jgi:hypothetical protein
VLYLWVSFIDTDILIALAGSSWLESTVSSIPVTLFTVKCFTVTCFHGHTEGGRGWILRGGLSHTPNAPGKHRDPANCFNSSHMFHGHMFHGHTEAWRGWIRPGGLSHTVRSQFKLLGPI